MHNPRTITRGDKVACDDSEGIAIGTHPRQELLIVRADKLLTLPLADDDVGELLVARRRPSEEDGFTVARQLGTWVDDAELCHARRILHITVAPRLVQLVRTQPCTCSR